MSKFIDLTGNRYNHLVVISREENAKGGVSRWKCLCDCGNYTIVRAGNLKNGSVKTCGCGRHATPHNKTHGKSKTKEYRKWVSMKRRCEDKSDPHYSNYGNRGIKVCEEWSNSFESFYAWVMMTRKSSDLTLERIDVNGDYCPENCTWVDKKAQANNRTSNRIYTHNGETKNLTQWCEDLGLKYGTIHSRIYRNGWSFEDAITIPTQINGYDIRKWKERNNDRKK